MPLHLLVRSILPFVGKRQYLYVGRISKRWRAAYLAWVRLRLGARWCKHKTEASVLLPEKAFETNFDAITASIPRLRFALAAAFDPARPCPMGYDAGNLLWLEMAGASCGRDVLAYLVVYCCPQQQTNSSLCAGAAGAGRLEMLQWLHEKLWCGLDERAVQLAMDNVRADALRYLREDAAAEVLCRCTSLTPNNYFFVVKVLRTCDMELVRKCEELGLMEKPILRDVALEGSAVMSRELHQIRSKP